MKQCNIHIQIFTVRLIVYFFSGRGLSHCAHISVNWIFLAICLKGHSSFPERHKLLTKKVCETPVHKQVSSRLLYRQKMGRYVVFINSLPHWDLWPWNHLKLLIIVNQKCSLLCFWLFFFRRSVPTEECLVEESPVKPAEGILLIPQLFVVFPHTICLRKAF